MHDVISAIEAQAETLSEFAERSASQTPAGKRTGEIETDAETLAELASHLNAMISVFTIERHEDPEAANAE